MKKHSFTPSDSLLDDPKIREAAAQLIAAVSSELSRRAMTPEVYQKTVKDLGRMRGRPLFAPILTAGVGRGARVQLADGSTVLDFIGGIGVYGFGHCDRDLLETAVVAAASDAVFQGNLMPGIEVHQLARTVLRHTGKRIKHVWFSISGAMANENALKLILQKHHPADRILAFENNFCGRTTTLAAITDRPKFRKNLPLHAKVDYVPFYDVRDPQSIARSVQVLHQHLARYPGQHAGMVFELVQGEGGIKTAPREFFVALMERLAEAKIAVWVDEVQTFGRTGELFAFMTFGLEDFVDVVTAGKMLQGSAMLYTKAYEPDPSLIAGTYAGSTVGMAVATRMIERMEQEGYLGPDGRISVLGARIEHRFESLRKKLPKAVGPIQGIGAMYAFAPFDGSPEVVNAVIRAALCEGLLVFSAGSNPTKIRILPPLNTTDEELEAGFSILETALRLVAEEIGAPC